MPDHHANPNHNANAQSPSTADDQSAVTNQPDPTTAQDQLRRILDLPTAVLLVAGIMIGSGVFKKIVPMAQALPDQSLLIAAWIAAGVITMFGAFTYAGLATMTTESVPRSTKIEARRRVRSRSNNDFIKFVDLMRC